VCIVFVLHAVTTSGAVSEQDVMVNVFQSKCITCHGKHRREAELDLRTRASLLEGGKSGPALVPGDPEASLVYKRIHADEMPPREDIFGDANYVRRVTTPEMEKLRQWIADGAPVAVDAPYESTVSDADRAFWAFQPPRRLPVPQVRDRDRIRTSIDAFLLEKLEAKDLGFSPDQDKLTLMRRAHFNLTGLPPSPEAVAAYRDDHRPRAYERMIDRLLDSPQYGERWGKYWLDAAGYADSHGKIDADRVRPEAWRYRDYVIRSLNQDKPYDRFLTEQIAGDELFDYAAADTITPERYDCLVATGFLRTAADDTDEGALNFVPYRVAVLSEQVAIFSSAVLGLTMDCARCHDHKYDPIEQRDYYRLSAIFQSALDPYDWRVAGRELSAGRKIPIPESFMRYLPHVLDDERVAVETHNADVQRDIDTHSATVTSIAEPLRKTLFAEKLATLPETLRADVKKAIETPAEKRNEIDTYLAEKFGATVAIKDAELAERSTEFKDAARRLAEARQRLKPKPMIQALFDMGGIPTPTYVARRGDPTTPGPRVEPDVPRVLSEGIEPYVVTKPDWSTDTSGRRLALARWLVQPNHPLTARVMMNRLWQHHFGRGLVTTPGNFGETGSRPSHPELLDWLATEFVRQGWRLKAMHRLVMTSTAYRQASRITPAMQRADPDNVLLSRFPMRRLDAEAVRDAMLAVSGRLNMTRGGPADAIDESEQGEVTGRDAPSGLRRSVYLLQRRSKPLTLLELFDAPRMEPNCLQRAHSTVPTQALQLWNSRMTRACADAFATRVLAVAGDAINEQIERVYWTALSRGPTADELRSATETIRALERAWSNRQVEEDADVRRKALAGLCQVVLNSPEFIYID
jgi:hypothetical protein